MPTCSIYFPKGSADLDAAEAALRGYGLDVARSSDQIIVSRPGAPQFRVDLVSGSTVSAEASEIGEGTPFAKRLEHCDSRYEVEFADLDEALDEVNTLMEVQGALQDVSGGLLFLPWNGQITEPWID